MQYLRTAYNVKSKTHLPMMLEGKECLVTLVERSVDKERSVFRKSALESFFVRKINICLVEEERLRSFVFQKRKICLKVRYLQVPNKEDLFKNIGTVHVLKKKYMYKSLGSVHVSKKKDLFKSL
jgi:hypothetical protein